MKTSVRMVAVVACVAMLGGCSVLKGHGKHTPVLGQRVPILAAENDIVPEKTLQGTDVLLPDPETNANWGQPGGNPSKSMGQLALGTSLSRAWTVSIPGSNPRERLAAAPVVYNNRLFVMDVNGSVHAFAADSGSALWEATTAASNENRKARFGGGVSAEGEFVYATNGLGDVVAMRAEDGKEVWRARPGGPLRGSPTVANGQVYAVSQDNQLFALNIDTGAVVWTASASVESQGVFGVAAPSSAQATVVAGFSSGELNAYRFENGNQVWSDVLSRSSITTSVSSLSDIDAEPVIDQGRVYAVGQGGRMVSMELTSGKRIWEQNIAGISTPWVAGEWIFVITDDARLLCIARGSGKVRWIAQLQHYKHAKKSKGLITWTGPILAGGRLLMLNSEGEIVSVSPADGSVTNTIDDGDTFSLPPVVAGKTLYVIDGKGRISAYR